MYIYRNLPANLIWRFGWLNFIIFIAWGSLVFYGHQLSAKVALPFQLLSTVGVAVAIYLSFKNGQSYDRQWEARKIWGELSRHSKILSLQAHSYIQRQDMVAQQFLLKEIVYRQLAFLNALRLQLRKPSAHSRKYGRSLKKYYDGAPTPEQWEEGVSAYITPNEYIDLQNKPNRVFQLLCNQYESIHELKSNNHINEFHQLDLNKTIDNCLDGLGKCERIKNTPFPRQYGFFSRAFTWIFILMLPLGLVEQLNGVGIHNYCIFIGLNLLISWVFITMEIVGDISEDPFENFASDVPISSICRNVEIELKSFLGEKDLPPKIEPKDGFVL